MADRLRSAVEEILKTKVILFPRQIVFKNSGKLCNFLLEAYMDTEPVSTWNHMASLTY